MRGSLASRAGVPVAGRFRPMLRGRPSVTATFVQVSTKMPKMTKMHARRGAVIFVKFIQNGLIGHAFELRRRSAPNHVEAGHAEDVRLAFTFMFKVAAFGSPLTKVSTY